MGKTIRDVDGSARRILLRADFNVPLENGGIVCLDRYPENDSWFIKWTLFPHID